MNNMVRSVWLGVIFMFISRGGEARRAIPDNNLSYPVLVKLDNKPVASGFYIDNHKSLFFVTAKHVLFKEKNEIKKEGETEFVPRAETALLLSYPAQIEITTPKEIELDLNKLYQNKQMSFHPFQDVAVIKIGDFLDDPQVKTGKRVNFGEGIKVKNTPGDLLTVDINRVKRFEEVLEGNDVFIFGYPTSLGIQSIPQIDYERPLLRKGIIAGKNIKQKTIILDCPVYYGNSGGPVVEVEEENSQLKFRVIGLILQFVPFVEEWFNLKYHISNLQINNSGYSVAIPMDPVLDLIW
ncbi:MAG: serine protease [Candidatus Omnitrophica bacterium]|nr:serine protease [Candidatus Omnitrophota bacterium]MCM8794103.1 serine protease [Candidatus Omnitrophota bacterium]